MRLTVNQPTVTSEVIDGEAIVINLDNGSYYSMDGSAAELWRSIEVGGHRDLMLQALMRRYETSQGDLARDLDQYLSELVAEGLVVANDDTSGDAPVESDAFTFQFAEGVYKPPKWTKFDDMQDLLVLDPIHDVSETGWPHAG